MSTPESNRIKLGSTLKGCGVFTDAGIETVAVLYGTIGIVTIVGNVGTMGDTRFVT